MTTGRGKISHAYGMTDTGTRKEEGELKKLKKLKGLKPPAELMEEREAREKRLRGEATERVSKVLGGLMDGEAGVAYATYKRVYAERRIDHARWQFGSLPVVIGLVGAAFALLGVVAGLIEPVTVGSESGAIWDIVGVVLSVCQLLVFILIPLLGGAALLAAGEQIRKAGSDLQLKDFAVGAAAEAVLAWRQEVDTPIPGAESTPTSEETSETDDTNAPTKMGFFDCLRSPGAR